MVDKARLIYNHMVMHSENLDSVFSALSDPTRRGILVQLSQGQANVSALASQHNISQPAISKHIKVLEQAGLVRRTKQGRRHIIRVDPQPIEEAQSWITHYSRFWALQFNAVEEYLQANKTTESKTGRTK